MSLPLQSPSSSLALAPPLTLQMIENALLEQENECLKLGENLGGLEREAFQRQLQAKKRQIFLQITKMMAGDLSFISIQEVAKKALKDLRLSADQLLNSQQSYLQHKVEGRNRIEDLSDQLQNCSLETRLLDSDLNLEAPPKVSLAKALKTASEIDSQQFALSLLNLDNRDHEERAQSFPPDSDLSQPDSLDVPTAIAQFLIKKQMKDVAFLAKAIEVTNAAIEKPLEWLGSGIKKGCKSHPAIEAQCQKAQELTLKAVASTAHFVAENLPENLGPTLAEYTEKASQQMIEGGQLWGIGADEMRACQKDLQTIATEAVAFGVFKVAGKGFKVAKGALKREVSHLAEKEGAKLAMTSPGSGNLPSINLPLAPSIMQECTTFWPQLRPSKSSSTLLNLLKFELTHNKWQTCSDPFQPRVVSFAKERTTALLSLIPTKATLQGAEKKFWDCIENSSLEVICPGRVSKFTAANSKQFAIKYSDTSTAIDELLGLDFLNSLKLRHLKIPTPHAILNENTWLNCQIAKDYLPGNSLLHLLQDIGKAPIHSEMRADRALAYQQTVYHLGKATAELHQASLKITKQPIAYKKEHLDIGSFADCFEEMNAHLAQINVRPISPKKIDQLLAAFEKNPGDASYGIVDVSLSQFVWNAKGKKPLGVIDTEFAMHSISQAGLPLSSPLKEYHSVLEDLVAEGLASGLKMSEIRQFQKSFAQGYQQYRGASLSPEANEFFATYYQMSTVDSLAFSIKSGENVEQQAFFQLLKELRDQLE